MVRYKPTTNEIISVSELIASRGEISATNSDFMNSAVVRRDVHREARGCTSDKSLLAN